MTFSADGQRLASIEDPQSDRPFELWEKPGVVEVWDTPTGQRLLLLTRDREFKTSKTFKHTALSPDGQRLVTVYFEQVNSMDGGKLKYRGADQVQVWDVNSGRQLLQLAAGITEVLTASFSPNGREIATWGPMSPREGWNTTNLLMRAIQKELDRPSVGQQIWNSTNGELKFTLPAALPGFHPFSPDGKYLFGPEKRVNLVRNVATNGQPPRYVRWKLPVGLAMHDAATGREIPAISSTNRVDLVFSPDGRRFARAERISNPADSKSFLDVKIWDTEPLRERYPLRSLTGTNEVVGNIVFSPDGRRLAAECTGQIRKVWETATGEEIGTLRGLPLECSVIFNPSGERVILVTAGGALHVRDVMTGQDLRVMRTELAPPSFSVPSQDGRWLAQGVGKTIRIWDLRFTNQVPLAIRDGANSVLSVAWSSDNQRVASGSVDGSLKIWAAATGQELLALRGHTGAVAGVEFHPDGRRLASGSADQSVRVWNLENGRQILHLTGHSNAVSGVAFSRDGGRLFSVSPKLILCSDAASARAQRQMKKNTNRFESSFPYLGIALSPDGRRLAATTEELWDIERGQEIPARAPLYYEEFGRGGYIAPRSDGTVTASAGWLARSISSIAFSPDGSRVAAARHTGAITIRDLRIPVPTELGREIAFHFDKLMVLNGHTAPATSVVFSPDGERLVSASEDGTLKIWDAQTGQEVLTLRAHEGRVNCLAISPDGHRLVSGGDDGNVKIWDATPMPPRK